MEISVNLELDRTYRCSQQTELLSQVEVNSAEYDEAPVFGRHLIQLKTTEAQAQYYHLNTSAWAQLQPLNWTVLQHFPPLVPKKRKILGNCSNIGVRFPPLVSRNKSILEEFDRYACGPAADFFITDPTAPLTTTIASLDEGCVNLQPWPEMMRANNQTHGTYLFRSCDDNFCAAEFGKDPPITVDDNMLLISSLRSFPRMDYQHTLLDFLAPAWLAAKAFNESLHNSTVKMVAISPWQVTVLQAIGIPLDSIFHLDMGEFEPDTPKVVLCTQRTLHLFRPGNQHAGHLPEFPYRSCRGRWCYADFWHRLFVWQVRHEITAAIAQHFNLGLPRTSEETLESGEVIFLQRCTDRRPIANEQEAMSITRSVLTSANRSEVLTSVCGSREDFAQQVQQMRSARLVIGAHGGALSNLIFAPQDAGVLEFVGTAAAHAGLQGVWPPYKSHWYGGAGAAFNFFKVVLYDVASHGEWKLRLDDYETALQEWIMATSQSLIA